MTLNYFRVGEVIHSMGSMNTSRLIQIENLTFCIVCTIILKTQCSVIAPILILYHVSSSSATCCVSRWPPINWAHPPLVRMYTLLLTVDTLCRFPQAQTQNKHRCLTLLGVSGIVGGLGLVGPWLGLVEVTFPGPGLVGLGTEIKERVCLEGNSENCGPF